MANTFLSLLFFCALLLSSEGSSPFGQQQSNKSASVANGQDSTCNSSTGATATLLNRGKRSVKPQCNKSFKFQMCCLQIADDIDHGTLEKMCKYPPEKISVGKVLAIRHHIDKAGTNTNLDLEFTNTLFLLSIQYIKCMTDAQDNSACCVKAGVPTSTGFLLSANCVDFCDGSVQHSFNYMYGDCKPHMANIVKCNAQAASSASDTAMRRLDSCTGKYCAKDWREQCH